MKKHIILAIICSIIPLSSGFANDINAFLTPGYTPAGEGQQTSQLTNPWKWSSGSEGIIQYACFDTNFINFLIGGGRRIDWHPEMQQADSRFSISFRGLIVESGVSIQLSNWQLQALTFANLSIGPAPAFTYTQINGRGEKELIVETSNPWGVRFRIIHKMWRSILIGFESSLHTSFVTIENDDIQRLHVGGSGGFLAGIQF